MHIGQSKIPTLKSIRQAFVVDPQQVHDRRLKVMNVTRIFCHIKGQLVRLPIRKPTLCSATCHPKGERIRMMVATPTRAIIDVALNERGSTKLAAPNDECIIEQTESF